MTIASALSALNTDIQNARTAITNKGGTVTVDGGSSQLATDIATIPSGGGGTITSLNVTPTTSAQTITASGGVDGYSPVNVSAVTSIIDSNIQPENIRNGVTILDVRGIYSATPSNFELLHQGEFYYDSVADKHLWKYPKECAVNGLEISGVDELYNGENSMSYIAFNASSTVASINGEFQSRLINGDVIIKDIKLITSNTPGGSSRPGAFSYGFCNTGITSLIFQDLETISVSATLDNPAGNPLWHFIQGATRCTTVRFPKLSTISLVAQSTDARAAFFSQTFHKDCAVTDMYFNSLTTTSFQGDKGTWAFYNMFNYAGARIVRTLHFPSNLQSTISGLQGYPLFGGASGYVVLAFDLTATE